MTLAGLRALVTGASRGIGEAVARAFANEGACVVMTARDPVRLAQVAEAIGADGGLVRYHAADLAVPAEREALAAAAGPIDVLVNNAGLLGPRVALHETSLADYHEVMAVNAEAVFHLTTLVVREMVARGRGAVINVSSSVGMRGRAGWGVYAVSKFAVEGMSQTLAADLAGTGVACAVVNPGGTRTDMRRDAMPDEDPATVPAPSEVVGPFLAIAAACGADYNGARIDGRAWLSERRS